MKLGLYKHGRTEQKQRRSHEDRRRKPFIRLSNECGDSFGPSELIVSSQTSSSTPLDTLSPHPRPIEFIYLRTFKATSFQDRQIDWKLISPIVRRVLSFFISLFLPTFLGSPCPSSFFFSFQENRSSTLVRETFHVTCCPLLMLSKTIRTLK